MNKKDTIDEVAETLAVFDTSKYTRTNSYTRQEAERIVNFCIKLGIDMNLKSCERCGVVLDLSKMNFATTIDKETRSEWMGSNNFSPILPCPVCKADIVNKDIRL